MAEYIEREAAYDDFEKCNRENPKWTPSRVKTLIARQKSADVSPVRHGRWEWDTEDIYRCSNCAEKSHVKEVMGHPEWDYCPNCGAKMDGGDGNSDICSKTI